MSAQLEERLRGLTVHTPSLNPLHASSPAGLGHARHLSSPMAMPLGVGGGGGEYGGLGMGLDPHMAGSPRLGHSSLAAAGGGGLLGPTPYSPAGRGHLRSRSHGGSPLMGAMSYGQDMPHLGLNDGLGGGLGQGSPYLGGGLGYDGLGAGT